jgi:hypothetical protein
VLRNLLPNAVQALAGILAAADRTITVDVDVDGEAIWFRIVTTGPVLPTVSVRVCSSNLSYSSRADSASDWASVARSSKPMEPCSPSSPVGMSSSSSRCRPKQPKKSQDSYHDNRKYRLHHRRRCGST